MDLDIPRIKALIEKREDIDRELAELVIGKERKPQRCSICQSETHTARTCPQKSVEGQS
jgi:hypothetical protein